MRGMVSDKLFYGLKHVFFLSGFSCLTWVAQAAVNVSTLTELREAVKKSDQQIVMKPGNYIVTDLPKGSRNFPCLGSNNTIDLSGVYINFPVVTSDGVHFNFTGSNNTFKGGTFEDTYPNGMDMPWCQEAIAKTRPESGGTMPWSTLMDADQPPDLVRLVKRKQSSTE